MKKLILASGGLDSATLLAKEATTDTVVLFFNYNQKAFNAEYSALKALTDFYKVKLLCKDITEVFQASNCTLLTKCASTPAAFSKTELEFRNGVFISCAISTALQLFPNEEVDILLGLIKIRVPYADCSQHFIDLYDQIARLCSNNKISVSAPFINMGKDEVLAEAHRINLDINKTWSCYDGKEKPCGVCDACIDRKILGVL